MNTMNGSDNFSLLPKLKKGNTPDVSIQIYKISPSAVLLSTVRRTTINPRLATAVSCLPGFLTHPLVLADFVRISHVAR